ncbi:Piwi-domain-containing protein [Obba rivulosa]|uniref:Piwi-domain-containing protein n=1 Tax=Obba rivulosa TaxID=1052685 RepID=A0A8E2DM03_9APHY|nr:Piwi-domain-containing protein [Obba rivulosa]
MATGYTASDAGSDGGPSGRGRARGGSGSRGQSRGSSPAGGPRGGGGFDNRGGGRGGGPPRGGPPQAFAPGIARIDSRATRDSDSLVAAFKRLNVSNEMPLRPGYGTLGRPLTLRANFFAVRIPKLPVIYDYDVSIEPATQARAERKRRLFELLEQHPLYAPFVGHVAHDQSRRLVSSKQLPQPFSVTIQHYEEGEDGPRANALTFTVTITLTNELDVAQMDRYVAGDPAAINANLDPIISALNLVLQQHASRTGVRVSKNKYFFPSSERFPLSIGTEAWKGFFVSIRPTVKQLTVNVNVCMTAFYTAGNLAERMLEFRRSTGAIPSSLADRLKIVTTHLGHRRKRSIFRIMDKTPRAARFNCEELGGMVSVEDYFKRKYRINLRYGNDLPVVDVGNAQRPNLLPPEICEIVEGQPYRGKLDGNETAQMIRVAANPPAINANAIVNEGLPSLALFPDTPGTPLGAFGIQVGQEMAVVPSRVLPPPGVTYKSGRPNVRDGSWNLIDVKFQSGGNMTNWAVLLVQDAGRGQFRGPDDPDLVGFLQQFSQVCAKSGLTVPNAPPTIIATPRLPRSRTEAVEAIKGALTANLDQRRKPSFILVLLSNDDSTIYAGIKRLCDVTLGIHTVHMLLSKARSEPRKQVQYFANVALKVNAKLGGMNHLLDNQATRWLTEKSTMLVGIDVTHPSGQNNQSGTPSIAAVVASVDDSFVQFPASMMLQKSDWNKEAKEIIPSPNLTTMMVERLKVYTRRSNGLPDRVFVYRDGVSEGQYEHVLQYELPQILEAFKKVPSKTTYRPKLTIAICGKRHHVRLYPTQESDMTRNGNTFPGTVVDRGITYVYHNDFYLQAHAGLQGTVKSTHYVVVYDENRYSADVLQQGTHTASYLYARATKAVSLVPAAYYADIACERARCYLYDLLNRGDSSSRGGGKNTAEREADKERVYQKAVQMWGEGVHKDLKESMFYI